MANTGATSPGTMANDSAIGTAAWSNPDNAKASDDSYVINDGVDTPQENEIKIVKSDGSIGATNKSTGAAIGQSTDSYISYGGSSDLWGETWSYTDINDTDFGVVFSVGQAVKSNYLKATNFGLSIPSGSTINGILVEIEQKAETIDVYIDHIRITVYYTEAGADSTTGVQSMTGVGSITFGGEGDPAPI